MSQTVENNGQIEDEKFLDFIHNATSMRREFFRQFTDPRRDIRKECGHPEGHITVDTYQELFDRDPIGNRVIQVLPKESWQVQPKVYEKEAPDTRTPFEEDWYALGRNLRGDECYHKDEKGSAVWEHLQRVDILSGVGRYGVLFLGLDDGNDTKDPASPRNGQKLIFLREFQETLVEILSYETDINNKRFGQPTSYRLTVNDPREDVTTSTGLMPGTIDVHWTRVLHVADTGATASSSEVFVPPRCEPVLDRVLDLRKLYGGSAEMYWKGAFPGISFETHPSLGAEGVEIDRASIRTTAEDYMNGLQRYLSLIGMSAKSLAPQVVDPTPQIMVQLQAICIKIGIPMRVFMGSERGEMASTQDDAAWNDRLKERENGYITPRIIAPFIDRLIWLKVLRSPEVGKGKGYTIEWPDLTSQTEQEKAATALQKTQALIQFISVGGELLVSPVDFLVFWLKLTEEEAVSIIENAKKNGNKMTQKMIDAAIAPPAGQMAQGRAGGKGGKAIDAQGRKSPIASQRKKVKK